MHPPPPWDQMRSISRTDLAQSRMSYPCEGAVCAKRPSSNALALPNAKPHYFNNCCVTTHVVFLQEMPGYTAPSLRSTNCVYSVSQVFGMVVGRLFVDRYFDKTAKHTASIVHCLR